MGIDACADIVELDVIKPVLECVNEFSEEEDVVFDWIEVDESESIFVSVAPVVNVSEAVWDASTL